MADIASLTADIKETNRLLKILDEYATGEIKRLAAEIIANKNNLNDNLKALEKKVSDLEKKVKK